MDNRCPCLSNYARQFLYHYGWSRAGKTTLLQELSKCKVLCVPEAARQIIREQMERGGRALPWDEIYATDNERKQTFEEAIDVFHRLKAEYIGCGYEVVEVPCRSVEERTLFVLDRIGMHRN
ncbi:MAG TPA: AAA family ATPase [Puia sp.]|nr:AAA family ATPase [Puia sp.]